MHFIRSALHGQTSGFPFQYAYGSLSSHFAFLFPSFISFNTLLHGFMFVSALHQPFHMIKQKEITLDWIEKQNITIPKTTSRGRRYPSCANPNSSGTKGAGQSPAPQSARPPLQGDHRSRTLAPGPATSPDRSWRAARSPTP